MHSNSISNRKRIALIMMVACIALTFQMSMYGCATTGTQQPIPWEQQAATAYELTGATMVTAKSLLDVACDSKFIDAEKCVQYRDIYKSAQAAYGVVGTALEAAINVTDAAKKQTAIEAYKKALVELTPLVAQVAAFVVEINAAKAGGK